MIFGFLGTLLVAIIAALFTYYLNLSKPDIRFTLSEEIPLSFSTGNNTNDENVQQLEVWNVGSSEAKEIVVKISGIITKYKVIKYISSDKVNIFTEQQPVEFVYTALPPQAGFKIIFTSSNAIKPSDIVVSHSSGQAVNALSVSNRSSILLTYGIFTLILGGYVVWIGSSIRNISFDTWKLTTKGLRIDKALKVSKPWYVSDLKWTNSHVELIKEKLIKEYVSQENVGDSAAFGLLNQEKPDHFNESDWKDIINLAENRLKDHISRPIDSYSETSILSVMRLSKPERFPIDDWNTIQTNANEKIFELYKGKLYGKAKIIEFLHTDKPEAIPDTTWMKMKTYCRDQYFNELIYEINLAKDPYIVFENNDLSLLDRNQREKLEEMVQKYSKYKDFSAILEDVLEGKQISDEKPKSLTDWEWRQIKNFESLIADTKELETKLRELSRREHELRVERVEVKNEQQAFEQLKEKVQKQLEFINNIISDPSILDRVESYDDTFSPGNWQNLKEIAALLNSRKAG